MTEPCQYVWPSGQGICGAPRDQHPFHHDYVASAHEVAHTVAEDRLASEERSPYASLLFTRDELAFLHGLVQERIQTRGLSPEWNAMRTYLAEAMYHLPELPADAKPRQNWERRPLGDDKGDDI